MEFRPCIDIHNGKVKQIVGGSLKDAGDQAKENFVSEQDAAFYAEFYKKDGIRGGRTDLEIMPMPNYYESLPEELWSFTVGSNYDPLNPQESLKKGAGGGHHGSHPHLVHEFVMSCIEERKPWIDEHLGGNITAAGICAHMSAMRGGEAVIVPKF